MKYLIAFALLLASFSVWSQKATTIENKAIHFRLEQQIDFVVIDTVLTAKKPVFLFCQGSLPVPLFVRFKDYGLYLFGGGVGNFNLDSLRAAYHVVVISMPETPLIAEEKQLNSSYCYITDTLNPYSFSKAYIAADYLQNYVDRANTVLKFLKKQPWVDNRKWIVAGHSQGTKVATKIAVSNKKVTHLGLFAPNPFGRADQMVRQARFDAQAGRLTWEEADLQMEAEYEQFKAAQNPDSLLAYPQLKALKTFSEPLLDDWLQLKIPIFMAYGTADRTSDLCDLVPLFFIQEHKNNLTMKRFLHLEHNFFETDASGKIDYDKAHWKEVMNTFLQWTLSQ